jgi:DNA-binding transcriptional regulator YhcF (GntR family)
MTAPKYKQVATRIRTQIAAGLLVPGEAAPSGAALARVTGYSQLTCRKALHTLIREGVLVPGASPGARPRVPLRGPTLGEQTQANAARALSSSLASRRRAAGLTQPQLAEVVGVSVTSIGHAETGRLWQSRRFWELADKGVSAGGELLVLHDAYRAAAVPADSTTSPGDTEAEVTTDILPAVAVTASVPVVAVTITWANGTVTTVHPPETPARPVNATPAHWPRGLPGGPRLLGLRASTWLNPDVTTPGHICIVA